MMQARRPGGWGGGRERERENVWKSLVALQSQGRKSGGREPPGHTPEGVTANSPEAKKPGSASQEVDFLLNLKPQNETTQFPPLFHQLCQRLYQWNLIFSLHFQCWFCLIWQGRKMFV